MLQQSTEYDTLADAFAAADGTYPIILTEDVTVTSAIGVNSSVTLDLAGHKITNNVTSNRMFRVADGTFTIKGNGGEIETASSSYGVVDLQSTSGVAKSSAALVVDGGTFTGSTDQGAYFKYRANGQSITLNDVTASLSAPNSGSTVVNSSNVSVTLNVDGGTFTNDQMYSVFAFSTTGSQNPNPSDDCSVTITGATVSSAGGPCLQLDGGEATLSDNTFTSQNQQTTSWCNAAIAVSNGASATVKSGEYTANYAVYIFNSGGEMVIDGGTFNGTLQADESDTNHAESVLTINDGTINGKVSVSAKADCTISGGEFSTVNTPATLNQYTVDGKAFTETATGGYYTQESAVALVNGIGYATLAEAFEVANATDGTVKLIDDVTVTDAINVSGDVTLDLNGKTITNNVAKNRLFKVGEGSFTINGNNGTINTAATSYGVVDMQSTSGSASDSAELTINGGTFTGSTDQGSYFKYRADGQSITLNDVTASLSVPNSGSTVVNGSNVSVTLNVDGGTFTNNQMYSVFALSTSGSQNPNPSDDCSVTITGATVSSAGGPCLQLDGGEATLSDNTFTSLNQQTTSWCNAAIAVSNGASATVESGEYTANYAAYIFNSGGKITVNGGTFNGTMQADESDTAHADAEMYLNNGTFNGKISVGENAKCEILGGSYSSENTAESLKPYIPEGLEAELGADGMYAITGTLVSVDTILSPEDATVENGPVFNLQGVRVADNAEGLAPGVYVRNGRIFIVRK